MLAVGLMGSFLRDLRTKPAQAPTAATATRPLVPLAKPTAADRQAKREALRLKKALIKLQRRGQARPKVLFESAPQNSFWSNAVLHRAMRTGTVLDVFPNLSQRFTKVVKVRTPLQCLNLRLA